MRQVSAILMFVLRLVLMTVSMILFYMYYMLVFCVCVLVPPSIDESNVVYFRKVVQNRTIVIECPVSGQLLIIVII